MRLRKSKMKNSLLVIISIFFIISTEALLCYEGIAVFQNDVSISKQESQSECPNDQPNICVTAAISLSIADRPVLLSTKKCMSEQNKVYLDCATFLPSLRSSPQFQQLLNASSDISCDFSYCTTDGCNWDVAGRDVTDIMTTSAGFTLLTPYLELLLFVTTSYMFVSM